MNVTELLKSPPVTINTVLNTKIWDDHNDQLKSSVRGALLRIAKDFEQFIGVPLDVKDIVITGGNANYTYTSDSDIDLHLIADFSQVKCDREAHELMDTKRLLYKEQRDLTINGIPVELYVEDLEQPAQSGGCYSIVSNKWLRKPSKNTPEYNEKELEHWVDVWHTIIKHSIKTGDLATMRSTMKLLRTYRRKGLRNDPKAEFSIPNLVYKALRNDDTVKGLQKLIDKLHDKDLSI
jgi:hypothetical protein